MTYFSGEGPKEAQNSTPPISYSVLGLIFGIISVFTFDTLIPQLFAVALSSYGLKIAKHRKAVGEKQTGRVIAITGLTLGCVYLFMWLAYLVLGRL